MLKQTKKIYLQSFGTVYDLLEVLFIQIIVNNNSYSSSAVRYTYLKLFHLCILLSFFPAVFNFKASKDKVTLKVFRTECLPLRTSNMRCLCFTTEKPKLQNLLIVPLPGWLTSWSFKSVWTCRALIANSQKASQRRTNINKSSSRFFPPAH